MANSSVAMYMLRNEIAREVHARRKEFNLFLVLRLIENQEMESIEGRNGNSKEKIGKWQGKERNDRKEANR